MSIYLLPQELEVLSLYHYSLKTKRLQCHYVMTLHVLDFWFKGLEVIYRLNFCALSHTQTISFHIQIMLDVHKNKQTNK